MPAVEKSRGSDVVPTIPRPPNSWILYRSDMVNCLAPPPPGTTRSQADVSRIISSMWKNEKPEVKAEYERRAEVKKLEHAAMYPNYRYMPKSKEVKEELKRAKEEKKKKKRKQRDTASDASEGSHSHTHMNRDPPFTSHTFALDSAQYVYGVLSPPLSAAASPSPEPPLLQLPQLIGGQSERADEQATDSQETRPYYRPHTATPQNAIQHTVSNPSTFLTVTPPITPSHYHLPAVNTSAPEPHLAQQVIQTQVDQSEQDEDQRYALTHDSRVTTSMGNVDYFSFNLQQFAGDTLHQWGLQNPEFNPTLNQFLDNTNEDCYQLQIALTQGSVDQPAVGPLEVEVGQVDLNFSQFQWDSANAMGTFQTLFNNVAAGNDSFENMAGSSSQASSSELSDLTSASVDQGFQFDQYINFNPTFDYTAPIPAEGEAIEAPASTLYIPPPGAAHVAGSWNSSFAMQDPIDV